LKLCPNQYDLVETLPLVGHAIKVRRSDGSMINPYLVQVIDVARHHKVVDTLSIHSSDKNELLLKTGGDDHEIINAVIPLFNKKDIDLKPFITS
jgi:hypothetical protein